MSFPDSNVGDWARLLIWLPFFANGIIQDFWSRKEERKPGGIAGSPKRDVMNSSTITINILNMAVIVIVGWSGLGFDNIIYQIILLLLFILTLIYSLILFV